MNTDFFIQIYAALTSIGAVRYLLISIPFVLFLFSAYWLISTMLPRFAIRIPLFKTNYLFLLLIFSISCLHYFALAPNVDQPQLPVFDPLTITKDQPLEIHFDRPFDGSQLKAELTPYLPGRWTITTNPAFPFGTLTDKVNFYPERPLESTSEYAVSIEGISPLLDWEKAHTLLFTFSATEPEQLAVDPENYVTLELNPNNTIQVLSSNIADSPQTGYLVSEPFRFELNEFVSLDQVRVEIAPQTEGRFQNQGNTLIWQPNTPLQFNTNYQLKLWVDSSDAVYIANFTTAPEVFTLDVPLHKQNNKFTCFAAASRMVLDYYGIKKGEIEIWNEIGRDTTERSFLTNRWGDPNKGIVGSLNGGASGGYGAHWGPVAAMLSKYRTTEIQQNLEIPQMLEYVEQGHPVMVWWVNGVWPAKDVSWNTPSGEKVYTVNGMHVEVVTGWIGDRKNPDFILTNDPWRGKRQYAPDTFRNLWKWFDNTAVVVK